MIPLADRNYFIKKLKEGMDIRAACTEAHITRSNLYKYFKEVPGFRDEVDAIVERNLINLEKNKKILEVSNMNKLKEIIKNRGK